MTIVPIYNVIALPNVNIYFQTDVYKKMSGRVPFKGERVTMIVAKEYQKRNDYTEDSFYPIGLSGEITEVSDDGYIVISTGSRVNIDEITIYSDHTIELSVSKRSDINDIDEEELADRLDSIKEMMTESLKNTNLASGSAQFLAQFDSVAAIAAAVSPWLSTSNEDRYAILAEDSVSLRTELIEKMLYENYEMFRINTEARSAQEQEYHKIYREGAIKKQMEYLQKELDEMHPEKVSDVRRLEIKIEESGMNETARREADKVLNRLKQEGANSAESGMLHDYLDFLVGLSWRKAEARTIDLDKAEKILEEDHYGLKKVKERIIQQIAVMNLKKRQSGSILLFVGAPGTGKTSIGRSIAKALDRQYVRVSLGGVRDEADIRGHRRTYIGAMPGRIMDGISKSGVSNPVMVLDEIDKLSVSYNGDPASALLEVLDPEQNNTFTDHYMNVPYDLSDVLFICTANTLDTIPEPLLNRMEVISFQGYTPIEKLQIAKRHLLPKSFEAVGLKEDDISVPDEVIEEIISSYTREGGVRGLKKRIDTLCRVAAVHIVRGDGIKVEVTKENLREYLDANPIRQRHVKECTRPGIVTGLAWTAVGGEILYIETVLTKGSGEIIITGQLGDVMKESAQIAVSLVKSRYPDKAEIFEKSDLHIHVPDGATPKDGPSAGITLTTAIASLVTGKVVDSETAMTGEVSLRGSVNPIGGLPEKLMAAHRAGVKRAFIPVDNEDDLRDVAEEVKNGLEIVTVGTVDDVLGILGIENPIPTLKAV